MPGVRILPTLGLLIWSVVRLGMQERGGVEKQYRKDLGDLPLDEVFARRSGGQGRRWKPRAWLLGGQILLLAHDAEVGDQILGGPGQSELGTDVVSVKCDGAGGNLQQGRNFLSSLAEP